MGMPYFVEFGLPIYEQKCPDLHVYRPSTRIIVKSSIQGSPMAL